MRADLILLDERDSRAAAERASLRVVRVLGLLLRVKKRGEIECVRRELAALRTQARFFVSPSLEARIFDAAGE